MANPEHLKILKQGVTRWNEWRKDHPEIQPNLRDVILRGASLSGADLRDASLSGARLSLKQVVDREGEGLFHAYTNLIEADLSEADLDDADLHEAVLARANLSGASLFRTNLGGADLRGADFTNAHLLSTNFADVDLSTTKGLDTVTHYSSSTVGVDTIYKSKGTIPEAFLRGCGVPEEFIAYIGSMVGRPIEYYSCFISYSTRDQTFANRLYADLQAKGVRCWFAPHDIKGGRKIHEQIDEAIRVHDKLLLILSEHSMASDWVGTEIANARERESREKKQMLFPITIAPFEEVKKWKKFDADRGTDSAREIREYYIPDFSGWDTDHGKYQKALEKLIADLKAVSG